MTTRRKFLQSSAAFTAAAVVAPAFGSQPAVAGTTAAWQPDEVIYDARFAAGREFAQAFTHARQIDGDVTRLWFEELDPRWRKGPATIAGLTAQGALFCLEHLARDYGLAVIYRGEHIVTGPHHITHGLAGPAHWLANAQSARMRDAWPGEVARLITRYQPSRSDAAASRSLEAGLSRPAEPGVEMLVSWVIAPTPRGRSWLA